MIRSLSFCLVATLAGALSCGGAPQPWSAEPLADALRTPSAGPVIGIGARHGGHAWLGIPFAKAPVGVLRWRAPQPASVWTEPRTTSHFGAFCPQFASHLGGDDSAPAGSRVGEEDCLFLNVYAPAFSPDAVPTGDRLLPVMVWIHGGGNTIGSATFYDPSRLATEQQVVVVTTNYRLGVLGWLRHPKLHAGLDAVERSGNFGTLDLIRALQWVRDNVQDFGGNPDNVTIFGESAGGQNVMTLLAAPLAAGLFHRAISESGGAWGSSVAHAENFLDDPEPGDEHSSGELLLHLLQQDGSAVSRAAAREKLEGMSPADVAGYLRAVPVDELFGAYEDWGTGMYDSPRVFRDGRVLPVEPVTQVFDQLSRVNAVPTIFGSNRDERKLFLFMDPRYVKRLFGVLPIMKDREAFFRDASLRSRAWKITGADFPAEQLVKAQPGRVFVYRFDWDEEPKILWADLGELIGAAHGFEIPFVFGHFDLGREAQRLWTEENEPGRESLSAAMRSYWAEFARNGDPGRGGDGSLPAWTPFDPAGDRFLVLDTPEGGGIQMARSAESMDGLVAELLADESYGDLRGICTALAVLADDAPAILAEEGFRNAGGGRCADFDPNELLREQYTE